MRSLRLLFIPLILQTLPSSAFSWSKAAPTAVAADVRDIAISANEVNALLLGHDALEKYSNRPDCFRRAAKSIRTRCAELEMDEAERVNAAISMTLCEVATAKHHSFPLECIPFSPENASKNTDAQAQGTCVDALARSAQFWSSYSGYLREIPQLCFAFRRWNDIDSAKEIYRNATLEKIGLIKMMSDREKAALANIQEWRTQINEIHALKANLQVSTGSLATVSKELFVKIREEMEDMIVTLNSSMIDFVRGQQEAETQFVARSDIAFKQLSQRHEMHLNQFVHAFEESLSGRMDMVFTGVLTRQQEILVISDELYARWSDLAYNVHGLSESFSALSSQVNESVAVVDVLNRQAVRIHDTQANALRSTAELVETLDQLMTTTNRQLEVINGTAVAIQESLIAQSRGNGIWDGWDGRWVINVAGSFLHPDSTLLLSVLNHPAFGILFGFLGFVCSTLCHTLATLISMLLCFFLSSRVFIWKLLSGGSLYLLSQSKDIENSPASSPAYSLRTPQPCQYLHLNRPPPSTVPLVPPGYRRLSSRFAFYPNYSVSRIPERLYRTSNS